MQSSNRSLWRIPLIREIACIVLVKLVLLLGIKAYWFSAPTVPVDGTARVAERLLGSSASTPIEITANKETSR